MVGKFLNFVKFVTRYIAGGGKATLVHELVLVGIYTKSKSVY